MMATATAAGTTSVEDIGVIIPPAVIRSIIERTATLTAKHGAAFEQRILANPENSHKFSFLDASSPYHVFYKRKILECRTGTKDEELEQKIPEGILQRRQREQDLEYKKSELKALTAIASESLLGPAVSKSASAALEAGDTLKFLTNEESHEEPLEPPSPALYTVQFPYATATDIEVISLTARFAARNGQKFTTGLLSRERGNPQFAFLEPTHPLFPFFSTMVEVYNRCITPDPTLLETLRHSIGILDDRRESAEVLQEYPRLGYCDESPSFAPVSPTAKLEHQARVLQVLPRVYNRARWEMRKESEQAEKDRKIAEERSALAAIDWNSFALVGTIDLANDDDTVKAEPPLSLDDFLAPPPLIPLADYAQDEQPQVIAAAAAAPSVETSLEEVRARRAAVTAAMAAAAANALGAGPAGVVPPTTIPEEPAPVEGQAGPALPLVAGPALPPVAGPALPPAGVMAVPTTAKMEDEETPAVATGMTMESVRAPAAVAGASERVIVVRDYKREVKRRRRQGGSIKCPITGRVVAASELNDHLRVVLMDPQWKRQRDVLLAEAQKASAVVPNEDLAKNLSEFVLNRPDMFGSVEEEVGGAFD